MSAKVITWTLLRVEGCAVMQMLPVALFGLVRGSGPHGNLRRSSQRAAAALCRVEVCAGNVWNN